MLVLYVELVEINWQCVDESIIMQLHNELRVYECVYWHTCVCVTATLHACVRACMRCEEASTFIILCIWLSNQNCVIMTNVNL